MKRFTETGKWNDPWFMDLPVKYKAFWFYICDQCDCAGIWEPNMRLAVAQIGEPMELVEILRIFEKRIEQTSNGKLWVMGFIKFQYGLELNPANTAHRGVIGRLETNKIQPPIKIKTDPLKGLAPSKGLGVPLKGAQDKDKDSEHARTPAPAPAPARGRPANQAEVEAFCVSLGLPAEDGQAMWLHWQEKGWAKIKDWKLTIQKWKSFGYLPSQRHKTAQTHTQKQPAPIYDKLPPTREVSDQEFRKHQQIAKDAADKFREEQEERRLRSV